MVDHGLGQVIHFSASSDSSDGRPSRKRTGNGQARDVELAGAVGKAVLAVPEVASLSPGHSALAVTYGATQRVTGVVVRHLSPAKTSLEVHVVLRTSDLPPARPAGRKGAPSAAARGGVLPAVAAKIREVVFRTFREMSLPPPAEVDVFIDDIA